MSHRSAVLGGAMHVFVFSFALMFNPAQAGFEPVPTWPVHETSANPEVQIQWSHFDRRGLSMTLGHQFKPQAGQSTTVEIEHGKTASECQVLWPGWQADTWAVTGKTEDGLEFYWLLPEHLLGLLQPGMAYTFHVEEVILYNYTLYPYRPEAEAPLGYELEPIEFWVRIYVPEEPMVAPQDGDVEDWIDDAIEELDVDPDQDQDA